MNPFNENKHKLETLKLNTKKRITVSKDLFEIKPTYFKSPIYNKNKKENSINYLEEHTENDLKTIYKKFNKASICLYTIHFIKNMPFLSYIFEKKNVDSENVITFPLFKIDNLLDIYNFIESLKSYFKIENINFKGYIENNGNLFLFFEYKEMLESIDKNFIPLTIHEICLTKKHYKSNLHASAYNIFFEHPFLMQLRNEYDIPYPTPIVCYYKSDFNKVSDFFGPLNIKTSYYNFYCYDPEFSYFDKNNIPVEKYLSKVILFLLDSKYIFTNKDKIDIEELLNYYSCLFIGKNVYTSNTLNNPETRIIVKSTSDFIILK